MTALLIVIITLGTLLLAATAYMEWIGVMNLFATRRTSRYQGCGHLKLNAASLNARCWRCRHSRLDHILHGTHS